MDTRQESVPAWRTTLVTRLLDDAEADRSMSAGSGRRLAPPAHVDADPGVRRRCGQPVEVGQARRRVAAARPGGCPGSALAERAEHPAQPRQGLPAGDLDGAQRVAGLGGLGVDDPAGRTGLDGDDADAVGDHVVQLAGDPQPFGGDRLGRGLGAAAALGVLAGLPHRVADQPGDDRQ